MEVLVLLDVTNLEKKDLFETHVKKEGFKVLEDEEFVYTAQSTTTTFSTKAYILEVFKKALQKTTFDKASMVFLLNETAYPTYIYDKSTNDFEISEVKK